MTLLAFSHHNGLRLAELAFLLILIAGVWLVFAEYARLNLAVGRTVVAGALLAIAGLLLIVAAHWGGYG